MYWNDFEGGHESTAVTAPNKTWLFAEGVTGGDAAFSWDTYLLLANPSATAANCTATFFRQNGAPLTYPAGVGPNARRTLQVSTLDFDNDGTPDLASGSFSTRIDCTGDGAIVAERAMCWSSNGITYIEGHNTPGVNAEALQWAFAEGAEGSVDESNIPYSSFFLVSNATGSTLTLRATFVREDGTGIVKNFDVPMQSRFTIPTGSYPELRHQPLRGVPRIEQQRAVRRRARGLLGRGLLRRHRQRRHALERDDRRAGGREPESDDHDDHAEHGHDRGRHVGDDHGHELLRGAHRHGHRHWREIRRGQRHVGDGDQFDDAEGGGARGHGRWRGGRRRDESGLTPATSTGGFTYTAPPTTPPPPPPTPPALPNVQAQIQQWTNERPDLFAQQCAAGVKYVNSPWQDFIVDRLRQSDPRWGYNGKPTRTAADNGGRPVVAAGDELAYFYGTGNAQGFDGRLSGRHPPRPLRPEPAADVARVHWRRTRLLDRRRQVLARQSPSPTAPSPEEGAFLFVGLAAPLPHRILLWAWWPPFPPSDSLRV